MFEKGPGPPKMRPKWAPRASRRAPGRFLADLGRPRPLFWCPPCAPGCSWAPLGALLAALGAVLGPLGPLLGPPGALLGLMLASREASFWSFWGFFFKRPWKKTKTLIFIVFHAFLKVFGGAGGSKMVPKSFHNRFRSPLGALLRLSGRLLAPLGALLAPLGGSWGFFYDFERC